jgi:hypothetical protein
MLSAFMAKEDTYGCARLRIFAKRTESVPFFGWWFAAQIVRTVIAGGLVGGMELLTQAVVQGGSWQQSGAMSPIRWPATLCALHGCVQCAWKMNALECRAKSNRREAR